MTHYPDVQPECFAKNLISIWSILYFYVFSLYSNILQAMFGLLNQGQPPLVQDNICGAVSRMIMSSPQSLPLDQVRVGFFKKQMKANKSQIFHRGYDHLYIYIWQSFERRSSERNLTNISITRLITHNVFKTQKRVIVMKPYQFLRNLIFILLTMI